MKSDELAREFSRLTAIIEKMTPPIPAIPPIPPILPIPAIPQIILSDDHNLLIKLDTKVDALKDDIKMLSDGTSTKINDHETRLRANEASITKILTWGTASIVILGVAEFILNQYLSRK